MNLTLSRKLTNLTYGCGPGIFRRDAWDPQTISSRTRSRTKAPAQSLYATGAHYFCGRTPNNITIPTFRMSFQFPTLFDSLHLPPPLALLAHALYYYLP